MVINYFDYIIYMGFFNGIKRAFGFSDNGEEHDDELDGVDGRVARSPYVNPFKNDTDTAPPAAAPEQKASPAPAVEVEEGIMPRSEYEAAKKPVAAVSSAGAEVKTDAKSSELPPELIADIASVLSAHLGSLPSAAAADTQPLRERLKQSEDQRRALQSRYNSLSERVSALEADLEQQELEKKALQNKLKVAKVQSGASADASVEAQVESIAAEYKDKMEMTNALLNNLRSEAARKTQEAEQLRAELDALKVPGTDGEKQLTDLQQKLSTYERQIADQAEEAQSEAKRHAEALAEKDEQIAKLKADAAAQTAAKEEELMAEMEGILKDVEEFKQKKADEVASLKKSAAEADRLADEAKEQLLVAQNDNTKLSKQVSDLNRRMADTVERHNRRDVNVANQIDHLKTKLKETERAMAERIEAQGKCEDELAALKKEHDAAVADNDKLAGELELLRKEFEGAKIVHAQIREECERSKEQAEELKQKLDAIAASAAEKDTEIESLGQKLLSAEAVKAEAEKVPELEKEMAALKAECEQLRQANGVLEYTVDALSAQQFQPDEARGSITFEAEDPEIETSEKEVPEVVVPEVEEPEMEEPLAAADVMAEEPEVEFAAASSAPESSGAPEQEAAEAVSQETAESVEPQEPAAPSETSATDYDEGIDDFLDDIDWLVPSPPSKKVPEPEPEPEPAPPRKVVDSRQMSLF